MSFLRTTTNSTLRLSSRLLPTVGPFLHARPISSLKTPYYTAEAHSIGGGSGYNAKLLNPEGPSLDLKMVMPKALGGTGNGSNPEEMLALGWAVCFNSALGATYAALKRSQPFPSTSSVNVKASIGKPANNKPGFLLAAQISISYDALASTGLNRQEVRELVEKAHQLCPYSNATKGNIEQEVTIT